MRGWYLALVWVAASACSGDDGPAMTASSRDAPIASTASAGCGEGEATVRATARGPIRGDHENIAVLELRRPDQTECVRKIAVAELNYEDGILAAGPVEVAAPEGAMVATVTLYACTNDISCAELNGDDLDAAILDLKLFESASCEVEFSLAPGDVLDLHAESPSEGSACRLSAADAAG
jgi:hypothetical protein